jgi:hypothetical protein
VLGGDEAGLHEFDDAMGRVSLRRLVNRFEQASYAVSLVTGSVSRCR